MVITATCKSGSLLPLTHTPALTTVFTPPAFCATRFHAGTSGAMSTYGWQDEVDPMWYSCVPPEWDSTACQSLTFSPALECPYGWTMDKSKTVLGPNLSSITFATCCMRYATTDHLHFISESDLADTEHAAVSLRPLCGMAKSVSRPSSISPWSFSQPTHRTDSTLAPWRPLFR